MVSAIFMNFFCSMSLVVRAIVHDIFAEHWCGKDGIDLFGIDVPDLAIQNEVVALGSEVDSGLLSEKDEGEAVAMLWARICEPTMMIVSCSMGKRSVLTFSGSR